jgi:hypothetical protein
MKEHSLFLEAGFVSLNSDLIKQANEFKMEFDSLLQEAVNLANGNVSHTVLDSGEIVTDRTLEAEEKTECLSGIAIDTALTRKEMLLMPGTGDPNLADSVSHLNSRAITLTRSLVEFKTLVLQGMLNCTLFTFNFPLLIEHIRREALLFIEHLERLQRGTVVDPKQRIMEEKVFWDRIMAEHSLFVAHLLDPSEIKLIQEANDFAERFYRLEKRAAAVQTSGRTGRSMRDLIRDETKATKAIKAFKSTGEDLILACQVKSLIIPLLADHVLREAAHFLAILTTDLCVN